MQQRKKTYIYHENILSIPASLLYDDWKLMSRSAYDKKIQRGQLVSSRRPCKGHEALLSYHDLPECIKAVCIEKLGDYRTTVKRNDLEPYIIPDRKVIDFFAVHRNPDGKELTDKKKLERATSCHILNAIKSLFIDKNFAAKSNKQKSNIWEEVSKAVNALDTEKWVHSLPTTAKRLKDRYIRYEKDGCTSFIHKGEGNQRTAIIKGEIADYLLAVYCLPIRYSIPELVAKYNEVKDDNGWSSITESAVSKFLDKPENKRIWVLARQGKEVYDRKYKHTIKRDKSRWFPNVYWAIDGTKLDLAYLNPETNKMEAYKRINIIFDVYSEAIIGWSFSETEAISDHFRAVKMAVQKAGVKPYLFTYDQQAGHKSQKMQDIYSAMVAEDGGTHYPHKARSHSSPAEGIIRRLQQQEITKLYNSDGLGITTKADRSHANPDFLAENLHNLPLKDDVIKQWEYIVMSWNNAKHFDKKTKTRNQVYAEEMLESEPLELTEILRMMWIEENKKPITYRANGIKIVVDKQEYDFEVYDRDGEIDLDFRRKHVGDKFIIRYDPDGMDGHIQLLKKNQDGEKYLVAYAEPKRGYEVVPKLMKDGEKEQNTRDMDVKMKEYEADLKALRELEERTGITRERMIAEQELAVKMKNVNPKKINIKADRSESLLSQW